MKPILLHGHERSITQIKYNREGDLIFSCAKDSQPNVWYSLNGERLGSFKGHNGAVWNIDVNCILTDKENYQNYWKDLLLTVNSNYSQNNTKMHILTPDTGDTTRVLTGAADNTCKLWDCETGKQLTSLETATAVRTCGFSFSGRYIMYTTDKTMGRPCEIHIFDSTDLRPGEPNMVIPIDTTKITSAIWGPYEEYIVTGHENGELCHYDIKTGKMLMSTRDHTKQINDIQMSNDMSMIVTASKDTTAKLFDTQTLEHLKTYKTERPVNSASLSPIRDHVVLGGGQEAMDVTTTSTKIGKFDARFYHVVFEEEFGRVKGHFGPINSTVFHPDGKSYSSGGEDGYVRVHYFDPSYFEFRFEF